MKQRLMNKAVTTQDGADVGTVRDVIIDPSQKNVILEVSKGPLREEVEIPWTQIVSIEERIVLAGGGTAERQSTAPVSNSQENAKKDIGSIEVLYYSDCPHYQETLQTIREVLSEEKLTADVRSIDLTEDAKTNTSRSSVSSPTVLLDETDIAPPFDDYYGPRGGHCRIYEYNGEMYPYPPKELIRSALKRQGSKSERERPQSSERYAEKTSGQYTVPAKQQRSQDSGGTSKSSETSKMERASEKAPPQQTTDSIEERRNRQLEGGIPAARHEARE
ncbi:MAG: PRC-barrel domain-containing protein [Halobacteriota archaeon]